jgi:hypothetical protein
MLRILCKDLAIQRFRPRQLARLMVVRAALNIS